ncbi:hypothetical protein [Candidatus Berkiella aquae]|uniref:Uncharacterized protein n=1 Tax=Candidatus Berkiella aquae TaxID=295108 RepID=A0A0Q9Z2Z4_9GAMM|nr:hypothetical protein [Candidatus Berkiella aquae]MCS5711821.1 hypothetical protein [Candidatus Berkiella aquae]
MKVSMRKLGFMSVGLMCSSLAMALPSQITFTNETSLSLGTSIAGLPGQGILPYTTKSASYVIVSMGCFYGSSDPKNCPIQFTDRNNENVLVATVYINPETGELNQAPEFSSSYADYEAKGWESKPIDHIYIVKKAGNAEAA